MAGFLASNVSTRLHGGQGRVAGFVAVLKRGFRFNKQTILTGLFSRKPWRLPENYF